MAIGIALLLGASDGARASSCISAVAIDGQLVVGVRVVRPEALPPREGAFQVVEPACSMEGAPDTRVRLPGFAGLPAKLAVASPGPRPYEVFLAAGSLVVLEDHPLHGALAGRYPRFRDSGCRPYDRPLVGTVIAANGSRIVVKRTNGSRLSARVDPSTRMRGQPAYAPVLPGQQIRLRTSKCGRERVIDTIAMSGPAPAYIGAPYTPNFDDRRPSDLPWGILLSGSFVLVALAVLAVVLTRWKA